VWKVTDHPTTSLILVQRSNSEGDRIVARFSYSVHGTTAKRGEDIGTLEVYEVPVPIVSHLSGQDQSASVADELEWIELVISGLELVVQHWKNLGKHFRSSVRPYRCKIGGLEEIIISRQDRRRRS